MHFLNKNIVFRPRLNIPYFSANFKHFRLKCILRLQRMTVSVFECIGGLVLRAPSLFFADDASDDTNLVVLALTKKHP